MKKSEAKTTLLLALPALGLLVFVFIWSEAYSSSFSFHIAKQEIAWEVESPGLITGNPESMRFDYVFCHRILVNYPTSLLARFQPGPLLAFLQTPKPRLLSVKTFCVDTQGKVVPSRQHVEWTDRGEALSETEYNAPDLRAVRGPFFFHVQLQWNDGTKPINLPVKMIFPTVLKAREGFSLNLDSQ